jgi:hypothetical protein
MTLSLVRARPQPTLAKAIPDFPPHHAPGDALEAHER